MSGSVLGVFELHSVYVANKDTCPKGLGMGLPDGKGLMMGWPATDPDNFTARDWDWNNVSRLAQLAIWHEAGSW